MPTYVYKFVETGETIEVQQSFDDDPLTEMTHPDTGARMAVKKVFLPVGITFKGSGFFKTDNRAGSSSTSKSAASAGSSSSDSTSTASSGSTDSGTSGTSSSSTPTTSSASGSD